MDWISAAIGALTALFNFLTGRSNAKTQKATDDAKQATAGLQEIDTAQRARDAAGAGIAADPGGLRRPDRDTAARSEDGIS